jgi:hypothetical protein
VLRSGVAPDVEHVSTVPGRARARRRVAGKAGGSIEHAARDRDDRRRVCASAGAVHPGDAVENRVPRRDVERTVVVRVEVGPVAAVKPRTRRKVTLPFSITLLGRRRLARAVCGGTAGQGTDVA